ncbi:MAG: DciA family protein [Pseudomonadota bacterium]
MPARKINFYIDASNRLRSLAAEARRVAELEQVLLKIIPAPLTRASRVKQLRDGTLFLLAENAAVAAKLKQLAPRLLTAFQKQRCEVTAIRVEVQVERPVAPRQSERSPRRLSPESIDKLEKLADEIEASPLKRALTNLAARQREKN